MLFQVTGTCSYTYKLTYFKDFKNSFSQSENAYGTVW